MTMFPRVTLSYLLSLHWLPVRYRILFKLRLLLTVLYATIVFT